MTGTRVPARSDGDDQRRHVTVMEAGQDMETLRRILDVLETRRSWFCPRCDRDTRWRNVCRDGIHFRFGCFECGLEEGDRLTDEEAGQLHPAEDLDAVVRVDGHRVEPFRQVCVSCGLSAEEIHRRTA